MLNNVFSPSEALLYFFLSVQLFDFLIGKIFFLLSQNIFPLQSLIV